MHRGGSLKGAPALLREGYAYVHHDVFSSQSLALYHTGLTQ